MRAVRDILDKFGDASGLGINAQKCVAYPVRCEELDFQDIQDFGGTTGSLPCRYLGLPLSFASSRELRSSLSLMAWLEGLKDGKANSWPDREGSL